MKFEDKYDHKQIKARAIREGAKLSLQYYLYQRRMEMTETPVHRGGSTEELSEIGCSSALIPRSYKTDG